MPFKSDKQRKYLYAKKPDVAKKLAHKYRYGGHVGAGESVAGTSSDGTRGYGARGSKRLHRQPNQNKGRRERA